MQACRKLTVSFYLLPFRNPPGSYFRRFAKNPQLKAFVNGVTAAATGAIARAAFVLGKRAIADIPSALIVRGTHGILLKLKKVPESAVTLLAGLLGLALHS